MGLASGVLSMGMALGFMLGSILSATFLSPWLGGWRHVLLLYGAISMVLCIPWVLSRPVPHALALSGSETRTMPLRQTLSHVVRIRRIWLLGLAIFGIGGCIQGTLGYLPLYLRGLGWPEASADGALAAFHTVSMICVIPIALWSDKRGSRKKVLIPAALMVTMGVSLLSVVNGLMVWLAVCMAGLVRDGFMAVFMTMIIETDEIGPAYAGTATGFVMVFSGIGSLLAPPLGNGLATTAPGLPFLFWAVMTGIGLFGLYSAKERSVERSLVIQPSEV
jgi:cyanate permease